MTEKERIDALREKINRDREMRGGIMKITEGAFGDILEKSSTNRGLVEDIIRLENGEVFTKFYGCSYLLKGDFTKNITLNIGLGKMMISGMLREIVMQFFLLKLSILLMYIFARKRLYHYLWVYSYYININSTATLVKNQLSSPIKEMKRAMDVAIGKERKRRNFPEDGGINSRVGNPCDIMLNVSGFTFYFLQYDTAYKFPLQDILELLNKENLREHFYREINRLFSILIQRTDSRHENMVRKWVYLKKICLIGLFLFPSFRRIIKDFLLELDIDKVKLDEADWYFCLQKWFHNYRGVPLEERVKEKERIDKEKGHIMLEFSRIE